MVIAYLSGSQLLAQTSAQSWREIAAKKNLKVHEAFRPPIPLLRLNGIAGDHETVKAILLVRARPDRDSSFLQTVAWHL
jgi:hypothetical protein